MGIPRIPQLEGCLPPGRQAFLDLNLEMLTSEGAEEVGVTRVDLPPQEVDIDSEEAERQLRASPLGVVMLNEGRRFFRRYDASENNSDLIIGDEPPSAVEVEAFFRDATLPKAPDDRTTLRTVRGVSISLWYGNRTDEQQGDAAQHLGINFDFRTHEDNGDSASTRMYRYLATPRRPGRVEADIVPVRWIERPISDRKLIVAMQTVRGMFELRAMQ